VKIKVTSRGETEFEPDAGYAGQVIREAIEDGCNDVASAIIDWTGSERSDISHDEYATVTEDDGTPLWSGRLDGGDEPAPDTDAADPALRLLALTLPGNDSGASTVGGYLAELLLNVWTDGREFDGRRPFGSMNPGWQRELRTMLSDSGALAVPLAAEEGATPDERANALILAAIHAMGRGTAGA
jgi:hypothetical protein